MILLIFMSMVLQVSSNSELTNSAESPHELVLSASRLCSKPKWDPLSEVACPLSVDEAVAAARRELTRQFPSENVKGLFVTCRLSAVDCPEIFQDIDDTIFVPIQPQFWTITFVRLDPFGGKAKLNLTYAVYLDGSVEAPTPKTKETVGASSEKKQIGN